MRMDKEILTARELLNDGDYSGALAALHDGAFDVDRDPARDGARRLAGCLMIVLGRCREGLALLEASRTSGMRASFPKLEYRRATDKRIGKARMVAIGLLECLALGNSAIEVAQAGNAFHDIASLKSLRLLAGALRSVSREADARLADELFVRWVRAVDDPWQIDGLYDDLLESGDRETAAIVRAARNE
jgi:hypothetical protein